MLAGTLKNTLRKAWGLFEKTSLSMGRFFPGKENVAFPIKYLSVCKFWCYVSPRWCSDCWEGTAYYSHPWNLSQFSVKMFSGNEKFSLESLYIQMHVHIWTANYWFIFAWQTNWTSKWRPTGTMHRQIKYRNRIIEGLSAKEAIPKGSHSR